MTASTTDTLQSIFLVGILAAGYVVCFALWWFIFRDHGDGNSDG